MVVDLDADLLEKEDLLFVKSLRLMVVIPHVHTCAVSSFSDFQIPVEKISSRHPANGVTILYNNACARVQLAWYHQWVLGGVQPRL